MVKLIRTLAPENGMSFRDIYSFRTMNYIGIWNFEAKRFALVAKSGVEFRAVNLPACESLDDLDFCVYAACNEHIIWVSDKAAYSITLTEGE